MTMFKCIAEVERTIIDRVEIIVDAEDDDEALDVAYEIAHDWPTSNLVAERYLVTNRHFKEPDYIEVKLVGDDELEDEEDNIA